MIRVYAPRDAVLTIFKDAFYAYLVAERIETLILRDNLMNKHYSIISTLQNYKRNYDLIIEYWFRYDLQKNQAWTISPITFFEKDSKWFLDFEDTRVGLRVMRQVFFKIMEDDIQLSPFDKLTSDEYFQTFHTLITETDNNIAEHLGSSESESFNYRFSRIFRPYCFNPSYTRQFTSITDVEPLQACRAIAVYLMSLVRHLKAFSWMIGQYDIDISTRISAFSKELEKVLKEYPGPDYFQVEYEYDGVLNINTLLVKQHRQNSKKNLLLLMYQVMVGCDMVASYVSSNDEENNAKWLFIKWKENISAIYETFASMELKSPSLEKIDMKQDEVADNSYVVIE